MRMRRRRTAAAAVAVLLALAACGTRASEAEVREGVAAGEVTVPASVLDELRIALPGGAPAGAAAGEGPSGPAVGGDAEAPAGGPGSAARPAAGDGASAPAGSAGRPGGGEPGAAGSPTRDPGGDRAVASGQKAVREAGCATAGAPLPIGQIGSFSGVAGPITASARTALAVWVKSVNERGGLACHPVVLFSEDDGGDSAKAAAAVQRLADEKGVVALVGTFATLTSPGLVSGVDRAKIPVVGGDLFGFEWHTNPNFFPQGAGIEGIIRGALRQTVGEGKTKLGLLYCVEASQCTTGAKLIPAEAKRAGAEILYSAAVSVTQTDFTAHCQNARNAGVEALGVAVDGSTIGRIARSCEAIGYNPQFVSSGLAISPGQAEDPGIRKNTVSTAGSNAPWMLRDTPGQREYQDALTRLAPGLPFDAASIAAWSAGKLFEAAIARLGAGARTGPITTADVFTGLGRIKKETLGGLAPPITFSPGQKFAPMTECVYFELLTDKGWTAPQGSRPDCG